VEGGSCGIEADIALPAGLTEMGRQLFVMGGAFNEAALSEDFNDVFHIDSLPSCFINKPQFSVFRLNRNRLRKYPAGLDFDSDFDPDTDTGPKL
jgi:hypothetical protein